jgi:adenylate cyclase
LSQTASDERLNRALAAFLRQEVQAPATAVTEFLDIIIEDARRLKLDSLLPDLNRMRSASVQLNTFVSAVIRNSLSNEGETTDAAQRDKRL